MKDPITNKKILIRAHRCIILPCLFSCGGPHGAGAPCTAAAVAFTARAPKPEGPWALAGGLGPHGVGGGSHGAVFIFVNSFLLVIVFLK